MSKYRRGKSRCPILIQPPELCADAKTSLGMNLKHKTRQNESDGGCAHVF